MNFFAWQQRALAPLLVWGAGNVVIGAGALRQKDPISKQIGLQAVVWGAINLVIAVLSRNGSRRKAAQHAEGQLTTQDAAAARRSLRRILLINIGLDAGYLLTSLVLLRGAARHPKRRGMGLGILIQGAFLFVYDNLLVYLIDQQNA